MRTGPSRSPSSLGKAIYRSTSPCLRIGDRAVACKRAIPTSIGAVVGPLCRLMGEKGAELKTTRATAPTVTKRLKRKVSLYLWPPTARMFLLETAATL